MKNDNENISSNDVEQNRDRVEDLIQNVSMLEGVESISLGSNHETRETMSKIYGLDTWETGQGKLPDALYKNFELQIIMAIGYEPFVCPSDIELGRGICYKKGDVIQEKGTPIPVNDVNDLRFVFEKHKNDYLKEFGFLSNVKVFKKYWIDKIVHIIKALDKSDEDVEKNGHYFRDQKVYQLAIEYIEYLKDEKLTIDNKEVKKNFYRSKTFSEDSLKNLFDNIKKGGTKLNKGKPLLKGDYKDFAAIFSENKELPKGFKKVTWCASIDTLFELIDFCQGRHLDETKQIAQTNIPNCFKGIDGKPLVPKGNVNRTKETYKQHQTNLRNLCVPPT